MNLHYLNITLTTQDLYDCKSQRNGETYEDPQCLYPFNASTWKGHFQDLASLIRHELQTHKKSHSFSIDSGILDILLMMPGLENSANILINILYYCTSNYVSHCSQSRHFFNMRLTNMCLCEYHYTVFINFPGLSSLVRWRNPYLGEGTSITDWQLVSKPQRDQ
jgi:hypothetical protein